jgi:HD superfamily phosphodiesterase
MTLLSKLFHYVLLASKKHNIDESHGLSHSMNVLHFANEIYQSEVLSKPYLKEQKRVIFVAAVLHDMCDKKYVEEEVGIQDIAAFLDDQMPRCEIDVTKNIIQTMSYSKVKKSGYPDLGRYQTAYHIVREADLLTAYDFDRCIIYNMHRANGDVNEAFGDADRLFANRVLKHNDDGLFLTDYSLRVSRELEVGSLQRIQAWKKLLLR